MIRESVTSSNILSVGYDKEKELLEVEFHNNTVYQYLHVPNNVFVKFPL